MWEKRKTSPWLLLSFSLLPQTQASLLGFCIKCRDLLFTSSHASFIVLPPTPIKHHAFLSFCETQLCFPLETPLSFPRLAHFGLNASFPLWAAFEWETQVSLGHPKVKLAIITSPYINSPFPLPLSFLFFFLFLFPAASNSEQGEKLLPPPLATIISTTPSSSNTTTSLLLHFNHNNNRASSPPPSSSTSLHHFVKIGLSFWFGAVFFPVGKT